MKTILATTYAVNPYKGSEDGMGWNYVLQIARFNKVIAITRENNRTAIEKYMSENPNEFYNNIQYLYFDLPYWMRFWKRKHRGALIYYYLWQKAIPSFVKKQNLFFDITHNLNFHNDWTPSFLWKLNKPFVWGPIGHHDKIPTQYLKNYSLKAKYLDSIKYATKYFFWNYSPALKNTIKHAKHIFCMNSKVANALHLQNKSTSHFPSVATEAPTPYVQPTKNKFSIISVGRFISLKGFDLTVEAFAKFINEMPTIEKEKCELVLVGGGPEMEVIKSLIEKNNIEKYVTIIQWIDRKELLELYKTSSVFLFPSHEGAGMVVAEALSYGLPVVCLNNSGPGEFINETCGFKINHQEYEQTTEKLADALYALHQDKNLLNSMSQHALQLFEEKFNWNTRGNFLQTIYKNL